MTTMRINKKLLKRMAKKPKVRPRIVKSLTNFDENINDDQNAKLTAKTQTSDTLGLIKFLISKMDDRDRFNVPKSAVVKKFMFNKPSLNFNFAALHQLKLIKVDWKSFKATKNVKGTVNRKTVF
ncbi:MAG: hypothetical protein AJITA_00495 [Acetilactobacillus jinshanensis]